MTIQGILYAGLLGLASAGALAQSIGGNAPTASGEVLTTAKLAGAFQNYDASGRVMRISNIEYAVSPELASRQQRRLRDLRFGQQVVFGVEGFDAKGRDIIVEVAAE